MKTIRNPLIALQERGQSIWYDNIRRGLLTSGELQQMVDDGLLGVTSNPSIFEKAVAGSPDYDEAIKAHVARGRGTVQALYEQLAIEDIRLTADVLAPVYARTHGHDGYVSMEVSPHLAHDTHATVEEARRLWTQIDRPNVMIKVPATQAGVSAIRQLVSEGTNINATLLFAVDRYEAVADAYMQGLEQRAAAGRDISRIASVASFFVSRIDSLIDQKLSDALDATRDPERREKLKNLVGEVAVANARVAYGRYRTLFASARWHALAGKGGKTQRVLWASTSTKNPKYSATLYVDSLIAHDTVNTVPAETLAAMYAKGDVSPSFNGQGEEVFRRAEQTLATLPLVGIDFEQATEQLLDEGVKKFSDAFDGLLAAVARKREAVLGGELASQRHALGAAESAVGSELESWRQQGKVRRLWRGDTALWSATDEDRWLGWLHVVDGSRDHMEHVHHVVEDARGAGFRFALLLGMGGSSLCPDVTRRTFGALSGFPELRVLDSTVPAQVQTFESQIDVAQTLFIVSSKSGSTTEPNVLKQYFFDRVRSINGAQQAGAQFMAITDPGSSLHKLAKAERFRHIAHGIPSIGGRYSAMSNFGMMPAGIMGVDIAEFLDRAEIMVQSCASCVPPDANPGVTLGVILGTLARQGHDKLTLVCSPKIAALGAWLEQLLAESTGKLGRGIVPVDGEPLGTPEVYGTDRLFVYLRLQSAPVEAQDNAIDTLERAGHPVVKITLNDAMDLGQEFFRWEIATAVAGAVLGINPFDQPDVEASKVATRNLTAAYERSGQLPNEAPLLREGNLTLFTDAANAAALAAGATARSVAGYLQAQLRRLRAGDYFAINAYVEMSASNEQTLNAIRRQVRDRARVATTLGFGPRFLHSTGQLHKGGPNNGVFLQITCEDAEDLPIRGQKYTFGILKRFQAQGDFDVLAERKRRALRVHLGPDVSAGLAQLRQMIEAAGSP